MPWASKSSKTLTPGEECGSHEIPARSCLGREHLFMASHRQRELRNLSSTALPMMGKLRPREDRDEPEVT